MKFTREQIEAAATEPPTTFNLSVPKINRVDFIIQPKNENQDLNYSEIQHTTLENAKEKAHEMKQALQLALKKATITVEVKDIQGTILTTI